jgi:hypothetical protein
VRLLHPVRLGTITYICLVVANLALHRYQMAAMHTAVVLVALWRGGKLESGEQPLSLFRSVRRPE